MSMTAALDRLSAGLEVPIADIEKQLKKLWQTEGGVATRASLINLAVYCEGTEQVAANTELIANLTQDHACRALLVVAEPKASALRARAWISAHCHLSRAGAKQICCEQITFLLEGESHALIPNIVFSHLDSDLPLYLWWQTELPVRPNSQLWSWVDRLIFDSRAWRNPREQFARLHESLGEADARVALCDLNWARSLYLRQAIAQTFDDPESLEQLPNIDHVAIVHAPGSRATAVLVVGWLQAQLQWAMQGSPSGNVFTFATKGSAKPITVELSESTGPAISHLEFRAGSAVFAIRQETGSDLLRVRVRIPNRCEYDHVLPTEKDEPLALLSEELMRGGKHQVFVRALSAAEGLF